MLSRDFDLAATSIVLTAEESNNYTQTSQVLTGYEQLQKAGLLSGVVNVEKLADRLLGQVFQVGCLKSCLD